MRALRRAVKTVLLVLSDRCLSALSCPICLQRSCIVACGQTVGRIKVKVGMQVGIGPGYILLYGDPAPAVPLKGGGKPPVFGIYLLRPNGWMHQHATWYGGIGP